jgi:hypothetical protein
MRYAGGVLESLVDLTYRGISLGRRIRLTQVRPSSGYLELAAPMPVGSELVIATDEGLAFGATVTWVHEQVAGSAGSAGSNRSPGMTVTPRLGTDGGAAWWQARVELSDDEPIRPTRSRPVTVRPRTHTRPSPPAAGALTDRSAIIADLDARIATAPTPATASSGRLPAQGRSGEPAEDDAGLAGMLQSTAEHAVVDDGSQTLIMEAMDPSELERVADADAAPDPGVPAVPPSSAGNEPAPPGKPPRRKRRSR